eukprot:2976077-Prymnesium_polylepis.1
MSLSLCCIPPVAIPTTTAVSFGPPCAAAGARDTLSSMHGAVRAWMVGVLKGAWATFLSHAEAERCVVSAARLLIGSTAHGK